MPTSDDRDNALEQDSLEPLVESTSASIVPAAPDYSAIGSEIVRGLREMQAENEARNRVTQSNAPAPEERELVITDDDDARTIAAKAAHNASIPLKRQMAAMQHQFQTVGLGTVEQVSRRQVLDGNPIYKRYKTECDTQIAGLDAVSRANPDVLSTVVDLVKARHSDELIREEVAQQLAAALKSGEGATPGSASGRNIAARKSDVPTPEELGFGEDQLNMIEARGGPDRFAQKVSNGRFNTWADYAKSLTKHNAAVKANKSGYPGAAIPFRRAGDKRSA